MNQEHGLSNKKGLTLYQLEDKDKDTDTDKDLEGIFSLIAKHATKKRSVQVKLKNRVRSFYRSFPLGPGSANKNMLTRLFDQI